MATNPVLVVEIRAPLSHGRAAFPPFLPLKGAGAY